MKSNIFFVCFLISALITYAQPLRENNRCHSCFGIQMIIFLKQPWFCCSFYNVVRALLTQPYQRRLKQVTFTLLLSPIWVFKAQCETNKVFSCRYPTNQGDAAYYFYIFFTGTITSYQGSALVSGEGSSKAIVMLEFTRCVTLLYFIDHLNSGCGIPNRTDSRMALTQVSVSTYIKQGVATRQSALV